MGLLASRQKVIPTTEGTEGKKTALWNEEVRRGDVERNTKQSH